MQVCSELNREGEDDFNEDNWREKVVYCRFYKRKFCEMSIHNFSQWLWINTGNRTEWSLIRFVIIQVIIDRHRPKVYLPINHKDYNLREAQEITIKHVGTH